MPIRKFSSNNAIQPRISKQNQNRLSQRENRTRPNFHREKRKAREKSPKKHASSLFFSLLRKAVKKL